MRMYEKGGSSCRYEFSFFIFITWLMIYGSNPAFVSERIRIGLDWTVAGGR